MAGARLISFCIDPITPATKGMVKPDMASTAMPWVNHLGESDLSSIYMNPLVDCSAFFLTGLLTKAGTDSSLNILPSTQTVNA